VPNTAKSHAAIEFDESCALTTAQLFGKIVHHFYQIFFVDFGGRNWQAHEDKWLAKFQ
jgi:hypothetical protein